MNNINKPLSLAVDETMKKIIDVINEAKIPYFCTKVMLTDLLKITEANEKKEIDDYLKNKQEGGENNEQQNI